jgi:anti-sigma B factor antagonist
MMQIEVDRQGAFAVARLSGESSMSDGETLAETLNDLVAGGKAKVAIDLSGLKLIDSTGLSVLMNVVARSRLSGGRVLLVAPSTFVGGVLRVTRLDRWFEICADMSDAARRLASSA